MHGATAETNEVRVGGVGTDADAVEGGQRQGLVYRDRVAPVEAAGNVGLVDVGHDVGIHAHFPAAIAFAEIAIE